MRILDLLGSASDDYSLGGASDAELLALKKLIGSDGVDAAEGAADGAAGVGTELMFSSFG